ncbi:MAG: hypothetical protein U9M94_00230, partial [Patescibacteria group bacterium]|nr:hypothetical protein [Patescibacteria group bacterium]
HKMGQLILTPGKKTNTVCDIFVAQTDAHKEYLAGKLFILIEIGENSADSLKIVNFLIDALNHNYYQSEKILLRERITSLKVEHIFEAALAKTNKNFKDYLKNAKIKTKITDINITAGIIHNKKLYLSSSDKNKAFLIYKTQIKKKRETANDKKDFVYKITDIVNQANSGAEAKEIKNKIFSNVISGKMPPQSYFFITNEALPEYLSKKQIIETVALLPPAGAVEQIKQTLAKINSYISFIGLIIKSQEVAFNENKITIPTKSSVEKSIINLNRTEDTTENLLSPTGIINPKRWLGALANKFLNKNISQTAELGLKDKILVKRKTPFLNVLKNIFFIFSALFKNIARLLKNLSAKKDFKNILKPLKTKTGNFFSLFTNFFSSMNIKNKILLFLGVAIIIIFSINLTLQKNKQETIELEENFDELKTLIEQKQNQAEANMLFSNEGGAKKLYDEIKALMAELPRQTEEQIEQYSEFDEKYNVFLEKIRRVEHFANTKELINISDITPNANVENFIYSPKNNKIYIADSRQKSIFIFDTNDNTATIFTDLEQEISGMSSATMINDSGIYYFGQNSLLVYDFKNNNLKNYSININNGEIADSDSYNNRLYLLDKKNKQILRYNTANYSFTSPYAWIGEPVLIDDFVSMSIDGHIYVLGKNNQAIKYLRGQALDFNLEAIEPPLVNPIKIQASKENDYLYVLEPDEKRLIVYDKNGQFVMQYMEKDFSSLKDFILNEINKKIYLLNDNSIYQADLTHLGE